MEPTITQYISSTQLDKKNHLHQRTKPIITSSVSIDTCVPQQQQYQF